MKVKNSLLFVSLVMLLVFSSLFGIYRMVPKVKGTYVEGTIGRDTTWTLLESPFTVSNDITISPGVTLTIEPGVEVRFGQGFSIMVNGRIVADGTDERTILFTSGNPNGNAGDWGTILISGTQQSSMTHCTIEYAANGVTVQSGSLSFQNNIVRFSSNGTTVNGGSATIENSEIKENIDGIVLAGDLTGHVEIMRNNVSDNTHSGILFASGAYYDTAILQNNVSSNMYGFLVETDSSRITRNSVSNNTVGIQYESGTGHEAHFIDIFDNSMGIDVSSEASVNATYNYWGDSSGPFHSSLNPKGKGNPVGGDGVNLDFIFFLSASFSHVNTAPTAVLQTDKTLVAPNQNVTFIGTNSYDEGRVDQYFFDFGDYSNSGWTTLSLLNHTYSTEGTYTVSLKVIDDFGAMSENIATTIVTVQLLTPLTVSMTLSHEVVDYHGNVTVTVHVSYGLGDVESATITLMSLKGGTFLQDLGTTNSSGYFETTFTAPNVTDTTYVMLVASASKLPAYADGSCHGYLKVLPLLHILLTTEPPTVKSEETVALAFHVTGGLGQPVANASISATANSGTLLTNNGTTGTDGVVRLNFKAPYTLVPVDVTIISDAQASGYTAGHDQASITVFANVLAVDVAPDAPSMASEANETIAVQVTCDTQPIQDATVTVSSGNVGSFVWTTGSTDSNGVVLFVFTAPQTTVPVDVVITVTAVKSRYVSGSGQSTVSIAPRVLTVEVTADSSTFSEANVSVTVHVTYNLAPVQNANVTITSDGGGDFSQPTALTDGQGFANFVFTAPQTNTPKNLTISAGSSKTGYVSESDFTVISVSPGELSVEIVSSSHAIVGGKSLNLTVKVTANSTPVVNAQVNVSANAGTLSALTALTDVNGTCTLVFNAPSTTVQPLNVTIVANVTKNGYVGNGTSLEIGVYPEAAAGNEGGWPWATILLLLIIPIAIVVIVLVLIKSKVIVVSKEEEGVEE